jgi:hypothetical protein
MDSSDNNKVITIFTVPKPFAGRIEVIQRNAIKSWLTLGPAVEIILIGDERGMAEVAAEFNVSHISVVARNRYNTPLVNSTFQIAQELGRGSFMAYVNADIIFTRGILESLGTISFDKFLVSCQRWDLDIDRELDFESANWRERLSETVKIKGRLHEPTGMDCFIFPRGMYTDLPGFTIGRPGWDNWLLFWTRKNKIPVIDATATMLIVHQNHDYSHLPQESATAHGGRERDINLELAGGWDHIFTLKDADWVLGWEGLKKSPWTRENLWRRLEKLYVLYPVTFSVFRLFPSFLRILRKIRKLFPENRLLR